MILVSGLIGVGYALLIVRRSILERRIERIVRLESKIDTSHNAAESNGTVSGMFSRSDAGPQKAVPFSRTPDTILFVMRLRI